MFKDTLGNGAEVSGEAAVAQWLVSRAVDSHLTLDWLK